MMNFIIIINTSCYHYYYYHHYYLPATPLPPTQRETLAACEGMSARSLRALEVHEGASGGFLSIGGAWRSLGLDLLIFHDVERLVQRTLADLSWIYARF